MFLILMYKCMHLDIIKNNTAIITIDGPEGVSIWKDVSSPIKTEVTPINEAPTAICSGVLLNLLAADAGIIRSDVTSIIPTIFNDKAITAAIIIVKIIWT